MEFCVIDCENSTAWKPISFADMFTNKLSSNGDAWIHNFIAKGEPLPHNILDFRGVVITGSRFNCRDRDSLPWFNDLCEFIRKAAELGKPNIYGGCFGCQIISFALGGKVDFNPSQRFVLKFETLQIVDPLFSSELGTESLSLIESHGDCVIELPQNSKLLAYSDTCKHEIFVAGTFSNILASQSHPEFDYKYCIEDRIWPAVVNLRKRLNAEEIEISKNSFLNYNEIDSNRFSNYISTFLRK
jgi:GMP synthase (glutamine-hydrolysing)